MERGPRAQTPESQSMGPLAQEEQSTPLDRKAAKRQKGLGAKTILGTENMNAGQPIPQPSLLRNEKEACQERLVQGKELLSPPESPRTEAGSSKSAKGTVGEFLARKKAEEANAETAQKAELEKTAKERRQEKQDDVETDDDKGKPPEPGEHAEPGQALVQNHHCGNHATCQNLRSKTGTYCCIKCEETQGQEHTDDCETEQAYVANENETDRNELVREEKDEAMPDAAGPENTEAPPTNPDQPSARPKGTLKPRKDLTGKAIHQLVHEKKTTTSAENTDPPGHAQSGNAGETDYEEADDGVTELEKINPTDLRRDWGPSKPKETVLLPFRTAVLRNIGAVVIKVRDMENRP